MVEGSKINRLAIIILCILSVIICGLLSVFIGSRPIPFETVKTILEGSGGTPLEAVIIQERIVRTLFCLLSGAALSISGLMMQAITRNPIADPSILGVNTGAALFVVIGIAYFNIISMNEFIVFALLGAGITALIVYGLSARSREGATPIKLALIGVAMSAAASSLITIIILPDGALMDIYRFWQVGSVGGAEIEMIKKVTPFLIGVMVIAFFCATSFNALSMGDDVAIGLGVNVTLIRCIGAICGVALCGVITALAGPIGFVGTMAPHITRLISGTNYRILIPVSAVLGGCLLTVADVIGRVLGRPGEVEVGIVTAFVGAPILVLIAMRAKGTKE